MIDQLLEARETESLAELCARLGAFLGLDGPAPPSVLLRAMRDPPFASDLITCRNAPGFLLALFDDPRTIRYSPPADPDDPLDRELAGKAAKALVRWGKAGFSTVDEKTLERRETACLTCLHLTDPTSTLQRLTTGRAAENRLGSRVGGKVCGLCGCAAAKKMRLPTESCPGQHPLHPGLTRWDEPRRPAQ